MLVLVFVAAADALASEHPGSTLADTLETESQRLRRVFYDLVEMTRIEAGALVVKPFDTDELLARIRVSLRHHANTGPGSEILGFGEITFDAVAWKITRDGNDVHLSRKEFALLAELLRHPGRVVTHAALLKNIWARRIYDVEHRRVAVRSLRQKLEPDPARPSIILNDPGTG